MLAIVYFTGLVALVAVGHMAHYAWGIAEKRFNTVDMPLWMILIPGAIAFMGALSAAFIFFYLIFMAIAGAMGYLGVTCGIVGG